jgi:hypothetical protein
VTEKSVDKHPSKVAPKSQAHGLRLTSGYAIAHGGAGVGGLVTHPSGTHESATFVEPPAPPVPPEPPKLDSFDSGVQHPKIVTTHKKIQRMSLSL